jgi:hypothetical protein
LQIIKLQIMRRQFLRTLTLFFATFAAMFVSFSYSDPSELDRPNIQGEILNKSAESVIAHRGEQVVYFSRFVNLSKGKYSPNFVAVTPSPALAALATCVLLC